VGVFFSGGWLGVVVTRWSHQHSCYVELG